MSQPTQPTDPSPESTGGEELQPFVITLPDDPASEKDWYLWAAVLGLIALVAFWPAINGTFLWDDDQYVSQNRALQDVSGLKEIWKIPPGTIQYYPLTFTAGYQSKSRTVAYAASIVLDEMKKIASAPVTEDELNISKRGFIDRFPRTFSTKAQIAMTLAQDEITGRYARQPDYWKTYRAHIEAVGQNDVLRVAKKYLTLDKLVILVVGQKDQILLGYPDHPVKLADLAGGRLTDVPLRDPLTMKPLSPSAGAKPASH